MGKLNRVVDNKHDVLGARERGLTRRDEFSWEAWRVGWDVYVEAAVRLNPKILASLFDNAGVEVCQGGEEARESYIGAWCMHWGFDDWAVRVRANNTLTYACRMMEQGKGVPTEFVCDSAGFLYPRYGDPGPFANTTVRMKQVFDRDVRNPEGVPHPFPELGGRLVRGFGVYRLRQEYPDMPPHDWDEELSDDPPIEQGVEVRLDVGRFYWSPTDESTADVYDRIMAIVKAELSAELDIIESAYRAHGYGDPLRKQSSEHFEWLALYQVCGKNMAEIAELIGVKQQSVSEGIHSAKDIIRMKLRPRSKPGPKPKRESVSGSPRRAQTVKVSKRELRRLAEGRS
jgi:hypothetical protein